MSTDCKKSAFKRDQFFSLVHVFENNRDNLNSFVKASVEETVQEVHILKFWKNIKRSKKDNLVSKNA